MKADAEGFLRPVIETSKCVNCGACINVCPVLNANYIKTNAIKRSLYAAYQKDLSEIEKSSSGAVFPLFAKYIINHGGVVYGATFTDSFQVAHMRIDSIGEIDKLRGSKYVQSNTCNAYKSVAEDLKQHKLVLFIGTPCEVGGLKNFLGQELATSKYLYTVDFICHGVPSPGLWHSYLNWIKFNFLHGENIRAVSFRQKDIINGNHS